MFSSNQCYFLLKKANYYRRNSSNKVTYTQPNMLRKPLIYQESHAILPKCHNSKDTNFKFMAFLLYKEASLLPNGSTNSLLKFCQKKILFNHILNFTVSIKCGTTVAENNTYFESGGSESGSCSVKICPCSDNICQVNHNHKKIILFF